VTAPSITADWLADVPEAIALLPRAYAGAPGRASAVAQARERRVNPDIIARLHPISEVQQRNRDALAEGAVCVVTGQQAGLFGGPLYTVYKAAAAIVNARALAKETGHPCVPVFWLQNEDHDFDEIAHCSVLTADGLARLTVSGDPGSPYRSVHARTLGPSVDAARLRLAECLQGMEHADEVQSLIDRCWTASSSPDGAFRAWLEALFAPHGLLVLDPSQPELAVAAAPIHLRAIDEDVAIAQALGRRSEALREAGYRVQVHVRPDAPLSFVHPEGSRGPRHRVLPDGQGFITAGGAPLSAEQVLAGPHSTSALLRPVLQDHWLPTAAYVGGPGEIAYFAQLPPLYEHFGLAMPLVVPRARFRVHDPTADRLLSQLGLAADALQADRELLLAQVARSGGSPDPDALHRALTETAQAALTELGPHADALDPGLAKAVRKTSAGLQRQADRLVQRYRKTLALNDAVTVERLDRLRARLAPGGAPQERVHAWPWFGARYGVQDFVHAVLDAAVPYDGSLRELRP